jgi:PIN domain nuclease of toxin-antitoxin system
MRLLLDTHTLVWWLGRLPRLGDKARAAVSSAPVLVSAVTGYEIALKRTVGKLRAPDDLEFQLARHSFEVLPVTLRHAVRAGELPLWHRDPFDRLLVAQAQCEGLTLVTSDRSLTAFDVRILPADE